VSWFRSSLRRRRERATESRGAEEAHQADAAVATAPRRSGDGRQAAFRRSELAGRPLADLHELAREHGVPRYRLLRKEQLIGALTGGGPGDVGAEPAPEVAPRPAIEISEEASGSVELLEAVQHLVHDLSSTASAPGASDLEQVVSSPATRLLAARDGEGRIVGMLTLAIFRIPTGLRAWIEDVVVAERARGQGVGEALTREALRIASESGARTVDLTSRRDRQAANRMYRKLGFERRETSVYRFEP
jgi:ribosomal protein S18 acetylase RimI-like enzyme